MGRTIYVLPAIVALILLMGCSQQPPPSAPQQPSQPPANPPPPPPPQMNQTPPQLNDSGPTGSVTNQTGPGQPQMNQTNATIPSTNQTTQPATNGTAGGNGNQSTNQTTPPSPQAYSISANDGGFYMGGKQITSLDVRAGSEVVITFNVLDTEVYHGGLDFRGCGQNTVGAPPGQSVALTFTPQASCTISSYWPSTGVLKKTLSIKAG